MGADIWSLRMILMELIMFQYHAKEARRIWRAASSMDRWKERFLHLMLSKGMNPGFFIHCVQDAKLALETVKKAGPVDLGWNPAAQFSPLELHLVNIAAHLLQIDPEK